MEHEDILIDLLRNSDPVLFLGAGFSYGCKRNTETIPTGEDLRKQLVKDFIKPPPDLEAYWSKL